MVSFEQQFAFSLHDNMTSKFLNDRPIKFIDIIFHTNNFVIYWTDSHNLFTKQQSNLNNLIFNFLEEISHQKTY